MLSVGFNSSGKSTETSLADSGETKELHVRAWILFTRDKQSWWQGRQACMGATTWIATSSCHTIKYGKKWREQTKMPRSSCKKEEAEVDGRNPPFFLRNGCHRNVPSIFPVILSCHPKEWTVAKSLGSRILHFPSISPSIQRGASLVFALQFSPPFHIASSHSFSQCLC